MFGSGGCRISPCHRVPVNANLWQQPFSYVGGSGFSDRLGWPIDHLLPYCVFDWAPGDGGTPYVGPVLDITDGGGPDETDVSPWQDSTGAVVRSAYFDGTVARRTATQVNPGAAQDVRIIVLIWHENDRSTTSYRVFSSRDIGPGISLFYRSDNASWSWYVKTSAGNFSKDCAPYVGWCLVDGYLDLDGDFTAKINGTSFINASSGGAHLAWDGIGIGDRPDGVGTKARARIARALMFFGSSAISNATDHNGILAYVFGARDAQRNGVPTMTRGTVGVQLRDTHYHLIGQGAARAGGDEGLLAEPTRINKVYNNVNPAATTGWSATGGTMSVVDDTAALRTAGLLEWGPMVHRFVPGGADRITYSGAATGNVNAHSISVWLRGAAGGESVDVGVRDASSGAFQNVQTVACTTAWQKVTLHGFIPGDTDSQYGLDCDTGDTIYHVGDHMEEAARCSSPIPNFATAATAQRNADVLATEDTPSDIEGSILCTVTPQGWGGSQLGDAVVVTRATGSPALIRVLSGTWQTTLDGSTTLDSGVAPVDATPHTIRLRWRGSVMSIDVDGTRVSGAYDGSIGGSGVLQIESGVPVLLKDLRTYRNGGG